MAGVTRRLARVAQKAIKLSKRMATSVDGDREKGSLAVYMLRLGLNVKATKSYVAVTALADRGLPAAGFTVCRSLLETSFHQEVVCRRSVRLVRWNNGNPQPIDRFGKRLSAAFRADLYMLHSAYATRKWLLSAGDLNDPVDHAETLDVVSERLDELETAVGQQWAAFIRKGGTPTGLPLIDVAASLGKSKLELYQVLYRQHSEPTHGVDALHHVDRGERANELLIQWEDYGEAVGILVEQATMVFIDQMVRFARTCAVPSQIKLEILELADEFSAIP